MTALARAEQNLIVRCPDPLNAETRPESLIASFLTPQGQFYIRSHGPTPHLPSDHRIVIDGLVDRPGSFSVAELQVGFPIRTVTATMQCAGNRRAHLQGVAETSGDPWDVGAIGNAEWTGVLLADVLADAGIGKGAAFVATTGADEVDVDGDKAQFGASISLAKACSPDVLLAWAMNGEPLTPVWSQGLMVQQPRASGKKRYGPGITRKRHDDRGRPSSDTA